MLRRLLMFAVSLSALFVPIQSNAQAESGDLLFVWVGDRAKADNNFIIVIDADPDSPNYGKLVSSGVTDIKTVGAHHTEYEMSANGILFANDHGGNRTAVIDLNDPLQPRQIGAFSSLGGFSMLHSFARLPNGNVLATFQYADHDGHMAMDSTSGGLVEIDNAGKLVRSVSNADPLFADEGLLPYSLAVIEDIDRVVVSNSPMRDDFLLTSNTYQLFRLSDLELIGTYRLDPGPRLNGHISPQEPRIGPDGAVYIFTLSCGVQRVTDIDTASPKVQLVHQYPGSWCGVPVIMGNYMVQAVPDIHSFIVLDISDGENPVEVSRLDMGEDYAVHWTAMDPGSGRLVVTTSRSGQRLHVLKLDEDSGELTIDEDFRGQDGEPGFSFAEQTWPHGWTGEGAPHGAVFSR
ncbi:hypothetical protein K3165_01575 [Qipengyuania sp. 1XM1-15A]|uniref:hypothetical protein n=1 Tax=Qipengyuania xiamenensis TaxID=2867237 RepID=UPI001C884AFC|nr:hypothetical protein [Qipengyuania xiamenensis]MBX7531609.1 hypothetical protein [Qipengyuania xiamenensis]